MKAPAAKHRPAQAWYLKPTRPREISCTPGDHRLWTLAYVVAAIAVEHRKNRAAATISPSLTDCDEAASESGSSDTVFLFSKAPGSEIPSRNRRQERLGESRLPLHTW